MDKGIKGKKKEKGRGRKEEREGRGDGKMRYLGSISKYIGFISDNNMTMHDNGIRISLSWITKNKHIRMLHRIIDLHSSWCFLKIHNKSEGEREGKGRERERERWGK